jgi:hypothetical protein
VAVDGQIIFNGLTIGYGTDYGITLLTGLHESPGVRTSDQDRARRHGQFAGSDWVTGRSLQASILVAAPHPSDSWQDLSEALVVGSEPTAWQAQIPGVAGGRLVQLMARVRRLSLPVDLLYMANGYGTCEVEWWVTDPRIYDAELSSASTSMATPDGTGFTFPLTFPLSFGGAVTGGTFTATNEGEFPAPWQAVIEGPVDDPRIENVTTGQTVGFVGSLAAGETLEIDSDFRSVLLDGTASRYSWLTSGSQWFELAPGDNQIRLAGSSGSGSMTFTHRSAWI